MDKSFFYRVIILSIVFLLCLGAINFFSRVKAVPLDKPLEQSFPKKIGTWEDVYNEDMDPKVIKILGVDDYVWRKYKSRDGKLLDVYISYFSYVDRIKTYHSPLNCMPGSGWDIYNIVSLPIKLSNGRYVDVNKLVVKNGPKTLNAIYWYQCRGRVIDSEYKERIYRVIDSIFKRRTDGAFVRIIGLSDNITQKDIQGFCAKVIGILYNILPS